MSSCWISARPAASIADALDHLDDRIHRQLGATAEAVEQRRQAQALDGPPSPPTRRPARPARRVVAQLGVRPRRRRRPRVDRTQGRGSLRRAARGRPLSGVTATTGNPAAASSSSDDGAVHPRDVGAATGVAPGEAAGVDERRGVESRRVDHVVGDRRQPPRSPRGEGHGHRRPLGCRERRQRACCDSSAPISDSATVTSSTAASATAPPTSSRRWCSPTSTHTTMQASTSPDRAIVRTTAANSSGATAGPRSTGFAADAAAGTSRRPRPAAAPTAPGRRARRRRRRRRRGRAVRRRSRSARPAAAPARGWRSRSRPTSISSSSVRARTTPVWVNRASTIAWSLARAAVCDGRRAARRAGRPLFRATTGLRRDTARATRAKRTGSPNDSRYSRTTFGRVVVGPEAQQVVAADVGLVAHRHERGDAGMAPLGLGGDGDTHPARLRGDGDAAGRNAGSVNVAFSPQAVETTPRQFGPTMRIPWRRAAASNSSCRRAPSAPRLGEPGRDDDGAAHAGGAAPVDLVNHLPAPDGDDGEVRHAVEVVDGGRLTAAASVTTLTRPVNDSRRWASTRRPGDARRSPAPITTTCAGRRSSAASGRPPSSRAGRRRPGAGHRRSDRARPARRRPRTTHG